VQVFKKPGVMDPVAASARKGVLDLAGVEAEGVRTGKKYLLYGDVSDADLELITTRVLHNGAIEMAYPGEAEVPHAPETPEYTFKKIEVQLDGLSDDDLLRISREIIRPFYQERAERATNWVHERFGGKVEYRLHKCEGSMFLWLWFPSLGITTYELYERLKARGVIIVPGRYFFPGLQEPWGHTEECVRINYAHDPSKVDAGLRAIAEEAARASA